MNRVAGGLKRPGLGSKLDRVASPLLPTRFSSVACANGGANGTLPRVNLGRHVRYIRAPVEAAILEAEETVSRPSAVLPLGQRPAG